MKYQRLAVSLAVLMMVVVTISCGGGGDGDTQPDQPSGGQTTGGGGLDWTLEPAFGGVELSAGFTPDPFTVHVTSGGSVDVGSLGIGSGCTGYAATAPDFRIAFSGTSSNLRIFFVADTGQDTTLIVNDPSGGWTCNDDAPGGTDPMVNLPNASAGQYDVWVGSYSAGNNIAGTLFITELEYSPSSHP
jgi:serine protease Do